MTTASKGSQALEVAAAGAAPARTGVPEVKRLLDAQRTAIQAALPAGFDAERFARIVMTAVRQTPDLVNCDATSLLGTTMLAAQLGLEPGPLQRCYLIPRKNKDTQQHEATFMLGYRGMVELALRSPRIVSIEANDVRANDAFDFGWGMNPRLEHTFDPRGSRGDTIASWALARFDGGGTAFVVLEKEEIDRRRGKSDGYKYGRTSPWKTDYAAMARKSAIRALEPFLPLSPEVARTLAVDGATARQIAPNIAQRADDEEYVVIDAEASDPVEYADDDPGRPFE